MKQWIKYPDWQAAYFAAITEENVADLKQRVNEAESAIFRRQQTLAANPANSTHEDERIALQAAVDGLRVLQREKLQFPDWK